MLNQYGIQSIVYVNLLWSPNKSQDINVKKHVLQTLVFLNCKNAEKLSFLPKLSASVQSLSPISLTALMM